VEVLPKGSPFCFGIAAVDRLIPSPRKLPQGYKFAVEIRDKDWLDAQFPRVLRNFQMALVLPDRSPMLHPNEPSQLGGLYRGIKKD
jgi:hypothetical protein